VSRNPTIGIFRIEPGDPVLTLTAADSGTSRRLAVGDQVAVDLAENPTTGYRWHAAIDPDALRPRTDEFTSDGPATGAPGHRRMSFEVLQPGSVELRLRNYRSWEPDEVVDEFVVTLEVTAPDP
jgi:inhibitor of cysteine peptidase